MVTRTPRQSQTVLVGGKIRQIRKQHGLTQAELAFRIGVQQSDLCRMENGEYKVSLDALFKILGVFGMDIGEFFREQTRIPGSTDRERDLARLFQLLDEGAQDDVLEYVRYKASRRTEPGQP